MHTQILTSLADSIIHLYVTRLQRVDMSFIFLDIDECASNPCVHGDCIDEVNRYECLCLPGWTGKHCDKGQIL